MSTDDTDRAGHPEPGSQPFPDAMLERRARAIAAQIARDRVTGTNYIQVEHAIRERDLADPENAIAHRVDYLLNNSTVHLELPPQAPEFMAPDQRVRLIWEVTRRYSTLGNLIELADMDVPAGNDGTAGDLDLARLAGKQPEEALDAYLTVRETPGTCVGVTVRRVLEARL
jgi:hypothetical protein